MKTIICIDGGVGRAITAIPALLRFGKLNPHEDWYVSITGWDFMYWGIPELQKRSFNPETKGAFETYFWDADRVINLEPYKVPEYYRQEIPLYKAFDIELNGKIDHNDDLDVPSLNLSYLEILKGLEHVCKVKEIQKKDKTIVIQPYGSTAVLYPINVFDESARSISKEMYEILVEKLMRDYNVIYFGPQELYDGKTYQPNPDLNLREWAGLISQSDYFIGCDSCGQHFARAVKTNGTVILGGTHPNNVSYPEYFQIIERDVKMEPSPMRISSIESHLANRLNQRRMMFTEDEIEDVYKAIVSHMTSDMTQIDENNEDHKSIDIKSFEIAE